MSESTYKKIPSIVVRRISRKLSNRNGVRKPREPNLNATTGGTFSCKIKMRTIMPEVKNLESNILYG